VVDCAGVTVRLRVGSRTRDAGLSALCGSVGEVFLWGSGIREGLKVGHISVNININIIKSNVL
jgi:hypothetical protein